jgi:cell shape-determining protein MreC
MLTGNTLSAGIRSSLYPLVAYVSQTPGRFFDSLELFYTTKKHLADENALLRTRIEALERGTPADRLEAYKLSSEESFAEALQTLQNAQYASATPRIADVVSYKDMPFGTLAIYFRDTLTQTDPGQVRYVFSSDGTAIGLLDSMDGRSAVVRLFTRVGDETHMRIGESELALVRGRGGVTLEAVVPKTVSVAIGDPVSLPEAGNALVGYVGEVTERDADTTQFLLLRLAATPQKIRSVFIFE